ncbi:MAG: hypothetical protein HZB79_11720 [Deltaproteobacteria bacterium]|nr:hypothetical protein [Deltaproteobacteria bacterium]
MLKLAQILNIIIIKKQKKEVFKMKAFETLTKVMGIIIGFFLILGLTTIA